MPQKPDEPCPDCIRNEQVMKEAQARETGLKADNDRLAGELAAAAHPRDFDTLSELVGHCEGGECAVHAEEWNKVKEKIVADAYAHMPAELVLAKAQERGFIPSRLVIKGGS